LKLSLCLPPKAEEKKIGLQNFVLPELCSANFRLSGQKLFLDFKNPFKITAEAEPERSEGEATIAQNFNFENWRYLLDKILTFFEQNPEDFAD
jgi:hypothetical protein